MAANLFYILLALFLVLLNGFFVAAEFGLVKLRPTRVKAIARKYGLRGRLLARVHTQLDAYLSACQLGITIASLGLGWIGEPAFAALLEPVLRVVGIVSEPVVHGISFFFAFFIISYLHIVVGELAPKSMAIRTAERVGIWTAAPLYAFYWLMYPAIWVLNHSANTVLRWIGLDVAHEHDSHYSSEEIKLILRSSFADHKLTRDEWRVLARSLDFGDLEVADLMRPFSEVAALSKTRPVEENIARVVQQRYSRYPYLDENGKVAGVVHLKDIFFVTHGHEPLESLDRLVRPAQIVPPSLPAIELFRRFREGAPHLAIVARHDGRPLGFLTLDSLLGALVGEIRDEFRQHRNEWTRLDDGSLVGNGNLPLLTLERALDIELGVESADVDTVAGLVLEKLRDIPKQGERVAFEQFDISVEQMDGPHIARVRVYPRQPADAAMPR